MNALELKGSIVDLVAKVNDTDLLNELNRLIREFIQHKKVESDWWDELTQQEQIELDEAIEASYDESNLVSHEEATATIQQWLNK